ncbi:MAG: (2E,6E)-farnesyl diphosphate synthase [Gammaproteobacteria bacterium]|nr:(2E,6E)-farnesyl diphosphate synthase [Gammaproteobacteria bacterium]
MDFKSQVNEYQNRVKTALDHWLPKTCMHPQKLHEAMRYSAISNGKFIRPLLVYATGDALSLAREQLDGIACSVETIHAYSLIHDDLPAMDDDDLRRGKPTSHIQYGEAMAILAGDALQALAFYIIAHDTKLDVDSDTRLKMINTLSLSCGSRGMAGGQAIDLLSIGKSLDIAQLEDMHIHKTGALIRASVIMSACASTNIPESTLEHLDHYSKCVGLAFQIRDDILDVEGDTEVIGKQQGADFALNKPTYPALLGLDGAKQRAQELHEEAMDSLSSLNHQADMLRQISEYIVKRIR